MIKALIFDFDGLIMDTESPEVDGWKAIYAEYGHEFPLQAWIRDVVGSSAANFDPAAHLAALTGESLDLPALHDRARTYRLQKQSLLPARPGVKEYVKTAKRLGLRLAVASSSKHAWVEGYLHQLGLFDDFEVITCWEDVQHIKPDPELFLKTLAELKLPADAALVFEDSPNGVLAARRAGLRVVAVPNPITAHAAFDGASLLLASMAELPLENLLDRIDLDIRPEDPADVLGIRLVEEQAFERSAEADLVDVCRQRGLVRLSLVAVCAGRITGHILFTPVSLEPRRDGLRGLGLGPVAVLPECQRTGIGSRLIQAGLETCRKQGYDFIALLGDPHFYARFGFTSAHGLGLSSDYGDGDEFQILDLKPGLLKGVSGKVKYIPEFKEMGC
ncbi:MAG: HAD-IA family hydrolase [Anaerolineales bacterium]